MQPLAVILISIFAAIALALDLAAQPPAMTPTQKEHSKLYKNHGGKKLTEPDAQGGELIEDLLMTVPPETPGEFLRGITCAADAVVVGTLISESSALTDDETFIFTDYKLRVEEILKRNVAAPFQVGADITVTRPGGTLQLNGRTVREELRNFRRFRLSGRYLLYLKFIPATGAYQALGNRSFELRANSFFKLTREQLWHESLYKLDSEAAFLEQARKSIAGPCK